MTFKKFLSVFVLTFFVKFGFGQVYQSMPQYGYGPVKRFDVDSTLTIPTVCGVPTIKSNILRKSAIAFDTCNNRFYYYNSKTLVWDTIRGGTAAASDTASVVKATVKNAESTTITKGTIVYLFGATGNMASVKRAYNTSDTFSSKTFAIVKDDILANGTGTVITQGVVDKLNLGSFNEGDIVWLDSLPGQFTKNKPSAPYHSVFIGVVERANNGNGQLYVKIQNGYELGELHNVSVNGQADNDVLYYQLSTKLWKAKSPYNLVDTSKLSARIDLRMKYTDTSSLSNRINLKMNYSDTASLSNRINLKQNIGTYLTPSDTVSLSNRINTKFDATSYEWIWTTGMQQLGSTIKGINLGTPVFYSQGAATFVTNTAVRFVPYYLPQAQTITGVKFYQANTANYTGNNYNGVGLYSYSGGTLTLVASTTNAASFWINTINTWVTKPFSSTFSASAGIYYIGMMYNYSARTTDPQTIGGSTVNNAFATFDFPTTANGIPKIAGVSATGLTALPSSITMSNINTTTNVPLIYLY